MKGFQSPPSLLPGLKMSINYIHDYESNSQYCCNNYLLSIAFMFKTASKQPCICRINFCNALLISVQSLFPSGRNLLLYPLVLMFILLVLSCTGFSFNAGQFDVLLLYPTAAFPSQHFSQLLIIEQLKLSSALIFLRSA